MDRDFWRYQSIQGLAICSEIKSGVVQETGWHSERAGRSESCEVILTFEPEENPFRVINKIKKLSSLVFLKYS